MIKKIKSSWPIFAFFVIAGILFWPFLSKGLIPLPADIVIGVYHPFRDVVWQGREAGFPVKNFTIFDPVRQMYPWRFLAIETFKNGQWPLWNPYQAAGTSFLGQIFTAAFYPANLLFWLFDFKFAWAWQIFLQPVLVSIFTYLFLRNLKFSSLASLLGSIVFAYSSFLMMRLEWNIVGHTAAWLPLILLAVDKLVEQFKKRWFFLFVFSLALSVLAGYLQATIYIYLLSFSYILFRLWEGKKLGSVKLLRVFTFGFILSFLLVSFQVLPLLELLRLSSRVSNSEAGAQFFLPWRHLIMFIAPDFFGSPATGNYWGAFNYTEFCGYAGIFTLFLVALTVFGRQKKEIRFWQMILLISFVFITPNPIARLPYQLRIPFISSLTPSRLIFLIDFSLAVLVAYGLDWLTKEKNQQKMRVSVGRVVSFLVRGYVLVILAFLAGFLFWPLWQKNALVSFRNLILPFGLLFANLFLVSIFLGIRKKRWRRLVLVLLIIVLIFDLLRQARKYNAFIEPELIFPTTKMIEFLQKQKEPFRFQKTDVELFPGNFQIMCGLEAIDGYDPFFNQRMAQLLSVGNSLGTKYLGQEFERDIFLGNHSSPIFETLNTKYILSLRDLSSELHLKLLMQEGKTKLYENLRAGSRAFLVDKLIIEPDEKKTLSLMLKKDLYHEVILEEEVVLSSIIDKTIKEEKVSVDYPSVNKAVVNVTTPKEKVLVLTDSFYPGWKVMVGGQEREILRVDYNLRGVVIPAGKHLVEFIYDPLSFKFGLIVSLLTASGLLAFGFFRFYQVRRGAK